MIFVACLLRSVGVGWTGVVEVRHWSLMELEVEEELTCPSPMLHAQGIDQGETL